MGLASGVGAEGGAVQTARIRARRRLIGALVLLAVGVVGFPVLFETQPRPLPVDTPILVPEGTPARAALPLERSMEQPMERPGERPVDRPVARPLPSVPTDAGNEPVPVAAQAQGPAPAPALAPASAPPAKPALSAALEPKPDPRPDVKLDARPAPELPKPEAARPATPAPEPGASASGRFIVQVGAYNDPDRLRAARQKVEKLGYKSYIQDVASPTGKRTRVRVGPFASREEADAVAAKVKASGMQANILTL